MLRILSLIIPVILLSAACTNTGTDNFSDVYSRTIDSLRQQKNLEFTNPEFSPLPAAEISGFTGLNYFDTDTLFRVKAILSEFPVKDTFEMPTTTERRPVYVRYGLLSFSIGGKDFELEAYRNLDLASREGYADYLFVPFRDQSSSHESYGGGRYIDLRAESPGPVILDFNTAYNPYCAYNSRYSCPIPPAVNTLDIKVSAGEKAYGDH